MLGSLLMMNRLRSKACKVLVRNFNRYDPGFQSRQITATVRRFGGNGGNSEKADWQTWTSEGKEDVQKRLDEPCQPGSKAFTQQETIAIIDLFTKYAKHTTQNGEPSLDLQGVHRLLEGIGERHDDKTVRKLFEMADLDNSGCVDLEEFMLCADKLLGGAPAGIILVVGGPGSGKGVLSKRLENECGLVHLSSGDLLRQEVQRQTILGKQVAEIMERGELVSSEIIVALVRRRMRDHPGKRVLLDGFPRSMENALDLVNLCGKPDLALHLECDDTILMERIMARGAAAAKGPDGRADDNFQTALKRLRTYHKYHHPTIQFLREQHVPIVELDCSVTSDIVWEQLMAIGRMMRPAVKLPGSVNTDEDDVHSIPKTA